MYHIEYRNIEISNYINNDDYINIKKNLLYIFEICNEINVNETIVKFKIIIDTSNIKDFKYYSIYKIYNYLNKNENNIKKNIESIELINVPKNITLKNIHKYYKPPINLYLKY